MLRERKYYIVNLANLGSIKDEDIGILGINLKGLLGEKINIPFGFILTTHAFDDFLLANDLVEYIAPRINDLDYNDIDSIKKSSEEIQKAVMAGRFPDLIREPIERAYGGLSGFSQANISISISVNNQELEMSLRGTVLHKENIYGLPALLSEIKVAWAEFFGFSALMYRGKVGYEGILTEAIVVQKSMQAEISGRLYSINPTDNDPDIVEIQAIWGMGNPDVNRELMPDSYFFAKKTAQLIEKKIISQDYMYVRKPRYDENEPFIKVQLSKVWQKKQKLDDKYLYQLFDYALVIERLLEHPFQLDWVSESGIIYITCLNGLDEVIPIEEKYPLNNILFSKEELKDSGLDIIVSPSEKMEGYVNEINKEIVIQPKIEIQPKNENGEEVISASHSALSVAESAIKTEVEEHFDTLANIAKDYENIPSIIITPPPSLFKKETLIPEPSPVSQGVEVVLKEIKDLHNIAKGKKGEMTKDVIYGISHYVNKDYDLEDLTKDEILVFDNINESLITAINKVKGILVKEEVPETLLSLITVPLIHSIHNLFEQVQDNTVITIDSESGKVFLGAGFEKIPEQKVEEGSAEVLTERQDIPTEIKPVPESLTPPDSISGMEITSEKMPDVQKTYNFGQIPTRENLVGKKVEHEEYSMRLFTDKVNIPISSTNEFWQLLQEKEILIDHRNTKGVLVTVDYLLKIFKISAIDLLTNQEQKNKYLKQCEVFFNELITFVGTNQIMLVGLSKKTMSGYNLQGRVDDFMNIDLALLNILRNTYKHRNLWYCFNDIHDEKELAERKKNVSSEGMRRSVSFKLFACLKESYPMFSIKKIVENSNIDGVIIDLDVLMTNFVGANTSKVDDTVANLLHYVVSSATSNNCLFFLQNISILLEPQHIKRLLEKGLMYFVTTTSNLFEYKLNIVDQEVACLIKKKKRGRKKKKIDFGF